jgi:hypothetical protein
LEATRCDPTKQGEIPDRINRIPKMERSKPQRQNAAPAWINRIPKIGQRGYSRGIIDDNRNEDGDRSKNGHKRGRAWDRWSGEGT